MLPPPSPEPNLASPVPRDPDPGRTTRAPMASDPGGMRVRTGHVTARRPHPTAGPVPIARRPYHRRPWGRRWNRFRLQRRGCHGWSGVSGTRIGRRLPGTGVSRRLCWIRVSRRLCRIGRRRILLGGGRRHGSHQDPQDHRVAEPTQRAGREPCRYRCDFHRVECLFLPLSRVGSCNVVSWPRTGFAMASSRLCAPLHSVDGRTCPSLPI